MPTPSATRPGVGPKSPGSDLRPGGVRLTVRPYPGGLDSYITPSVFHRVFAHDVPKRTAAVMAATQRPFDLAILEELSGPPAWRTIPSWYLIATEDRAIPPATQRFMADRAGIPTEAAVPIVETYEHYSPISAHVFPLREAEARAARSP